MKNEDIIRNHEEITCDACGKVFDTEDVPHRLVLKLIKPERRVVHYFCGAKHLEIWVKVYNDSNGKIILLKPSRN